MGGLSGTTAFAAVFTRRSSFRLASRSPTCRSQLACHPTFRAQHALQKRRHIQIGIQPRPVKTDVRSDGYVEVTEGLKAGEPVVIAANFLIDAESNLKAALSSFTADAQAENKMDAKP